MKQIDESDCVQLSWRDPEWPSRKFKDFLEIPGATGVIGRKAFAIGVEYNGFFDIERFNWRDEEDLDELLSELTLRFDEVSVNLELGPDNWTILKLDEKGFSIECVGMMKIRMYTRKCNR